MANDEWLTVKDVEDIHHALNLGTSADRISTAISRFKAATLPALVEYGCLRWAYPQLPSLSEEVAASTIGRSLQLVVSPLGLRSSGLPAARPIDLKPRPSEFWVFEGEDVASDDAEFFKSRFWASALSVGFSRSVANFLATGLHEMMTNAAQHSAADVPILAGYVVYPSFAQFSVVDVGRGVLAALQSVERYQHVSRHADAVRLAVHDGVTSEPSGNGGFGFHDIFKALTEQWGYLRFRSGEACLIADGTGLDADAGENRTVPALPGFQVSVSCRAGIARLSHPTM